MVLPRTRRKGTANSALVQRQCRLFPKGLVLAFAGIWFILGVSLPSIPTLNPSMASGYGLWDIDQPPQTKNEKGNKQAVRMRHRINQLSTLTFNKTPVVKSAPAKLSQPSSPQGDKDQPTPCLWKDLPVPGVAKSSPDSLKVVVTSSHPIADGTSFVVLGNTSRITCGDQPPMRDLILSDPFQNNNFNVHRIDCPTGLPLRMGDATCPALTKSDPSIPKDKKTVICMAPLYKAGKYTRYLIEWLLYHQALGIDHVVVPNYDEEEGDEWKILQQFEKTGFVRIVPWSPKATNNWVSRGRLYEHGKLPAWNRCYLEYHEHADWMLFLDIDESLDVKTTIEDALQWMSKFGEEKVGFSLKNRAITGVLDEPKKDELLYAQHSAMEAEPLCPYSCGVFHNGRWKYFARGGKLINEVLWTHSINGLDYTKANKIMELVPEDSVAAVRHFQAHWYSWKLFNKGLEAKHFRSKKRAIQPDILEKMRKRIEEDFREIYYKGAPGISWTEINKKGPMPQDVLDTIRNPEPADQVDKFAVALQNYG